jgi:hypothetical protein
MPTYRSRRFHWLKPGTLNTFSVRAVSGINQSEAAEIILKTSGFVGMTWASSAKVIARPVFWNRTIVVTWTLINEPLRMDYYRLFRKAGSVPSAPELADNSKTSAYWVEDTGRGNRHVDHILGTDPDIVKEVTYYYWVWAFDKSGMASAHYLGGSGPNTTPDNAEFGKPNVPVIYPALFSYEHQDIIKFLCDVTVKFRCSGGAEGYWMQKRQKGRAMWGPLVWADHDGDLVNQECIMQNLIAGKTYEFRVKAVNVPVALVSNWSTTVEKPIPYDSVPPAEIQGVSAKRIYRAGFRKGEFIRVNWKRPALAVLSEQIEHYEVYRKVGSDAQALTELAAINANTATPYDEMTQLEGTRFVDDNIIPLTTVLANFDWDGDYNNGATDQDRRTAVISGGTLVGTLNNGATIVTDQAYDGTYSLKCLASTLNYLSFTNNGIFNSNEGYIKIWWYPTSIGFGTNNIFRAYYDANNYLDIYFFSARIAVNFCGNGNLESGQIHYGPSQLPQMNQWNSIELRWKVSTNTFECMANYPVGDASWRDLGPTSMTAFTNEPTEITLGPVASTDNFVHYIDGVESWGFDGPSAQQYYHYFVRGVDVDNRKSTVTLTDSYDKVSFAKPEAPTNVAIVQNVVQILLWKMQTIKFTWTSVDEAVWYRVKLRLKGPGRASWGPWLYTAKLPEELISDVDDDNPGGVPKYVYPFPVFKDTLIQYAVSAENMAGKTWSATTDATINADDEGPGVIQNLTGNCHGINFFSVKLWMGYTLKWDDRPWYEGIASYEVWWWNGSGWQSVGFRKPTIIPGKKVVFNGLALPIAGLHQFKVIATDGDGNTSESSILDLTWSAWWNFIAS